MRRTLFIRTIIISLLFLGAFGCLPETKRVVVQPKKEAVPPPPLPVLPIDLIDKKIAHLNNMLETKELDREDRETALNLLDAYKTIRSQENTTRYDDRKLIHLLFTNLSELDEKYFSKDRGEVKQDAEVITAFSLKRKKIQDDYLSGDYQGVIDDCLELEAAFGPDSLGPEIGLFFAVSLAKKGMLEEALSISGRIIHELEGRPDLIHLRSNMIEWQLALGNKKKALQEYEKLLDDLNEREIVFNRTSEVVTGRKQLVEPYERKSIKPYSTKLREPQQPGPMGKLLTRVDELIQRHEFNEAKLLLIRQRLRTEKGSEIEIIDRALKTVEMAEASFQKEKSVDLDQEEETIKVAKKLIEQENFEEAITKLDQLQGARDTGPEIKKLRDLAIEKLINQERNKAAKLFLMAKKTPDTEKKEGLLLSSYDILKALIEKYPSSDLINKLNHHIQKVREELRKLGIDPEN